MLKIPSLANLSAFIAVGKRKSFKHAADDLMLTPGAVSQKIKQLEGQLGCKLFHRSSRGVSFTEKGDRYYTAVFPLMSELACLTQKFFGQEEKQSLVISVMPAFALRWLIPRLDTFHQEHPQLTVNINATERLVDFEADDVNIAIRHGLGDYPDLCSDRLFSEDLVPVCSPTVLKKMGPLRSIRDLKKFTLLHDHIAKDWPLLLGAIGETEIDSNAGPRFDNDNLMIQSAIEGHGVALARASLVEGEIKNGDLVALLDVSIPSKFAYYAVYPKNRLNTAENRVFLDWLLRQSTEYSQNE